MTSGDIIFNKIKDKLVLGKNYLVKFKQKYKWEYNWDIICCYIESDDDDWIWEFDFDEGQEDAEGRRGNLRKT